MPNPGKAAPLALLPPIIPNKSKSRSLSPPTMDWWGGTIGSRELPSICCVRRCCCAFVNCWNTWSSSTGGNVEFCNNSWLKSSAWKSLLKESSMFAILSRVCFSESPRARMFSALSELVELDEFEGGRFVAGVPKVADTTAENSLKLMFGCCCWLGSSLPLDSPLPSTVAKIPSPDGSICDVSILVLADCVIPGKDGCGDWLGIDFSIEAAGPLF
mmetsp:Transcript_14721/g.19296  ORF Transcript_14721/g.19296 Transcript_14721/m.19296 type:complete len:215 (-) Transcript_14721:711-1355(-)